MDATPIARLQRTNQEGVRYDEVEVGAPLGLGGAPCRVDDHNYINPRLGDIPLRALRVEHIDRLYHALLTHGSPHRWRACIQDRLRRPRHHPLLAQ